LAIQKDAKFCTYCGATVRSRETTVPSGQSPTRLCLACGRSYPSEYSFCPYCGTYPAGAPSQPSTPDQLYPTYHKEPLGAIKYVAYIVAFLIPLVGVIWGIIWLLDKDQEKKDAGKITLVVALVGWLLNFLCIIWLGLY
jgi:RNA polymerase subunit RPABC4/transcription elongation factor Spt4